MTETEPPPTDLRSPARLNRVVIVGVGLLGGSLGLALLERGLAETVVGVGRNPKSLNVAERRGCVTETTTDLLVAVNGADVIVLCTPVATIGDMAASLADIVNPTALVTDVGSVKGAVADEIDRRAASLPFVGSHPMAGGTRIGAEHARADLFLSACTIVTPNDSTPADRTRRAERFWQSVGSRTVTMSPARHDEVVAQISHLPHLVAAALATVPDDEARRCVGRGFLDTTRVAGGDVELWRQILTLNRPAVLAALGAMESKLAAWRTALESGDKNLIGGAVTDDSTTHHFDIEHLLSAGKRVRDALAD